MLPPFVLASLRRQVPPNTRSRWDHEEKFGQVGRIVHREVAGERLVNVGDAVVKGKWKTVPDFLIDYVRGRFTAEWGVGELKKASADQHPLIRMYLGMLRFMRREQRRQRVVNGVFAARPNGDAAHFLNLAYDLYVLDDHRLLQKRLLNRLRLRQNYQGSRYELFVAATCIRAGLALQFEDEDDNSRRHPEFVAVHKTSIRVAVEAKSRHRPGVLGSGGDLGRALAAAKADVVPLLNDALNKKPGIPFIVFIDVNLPASANAKHWLRSFLTAYKNLPAERSEIANAVILTNIPHHFGDPAGFDPPKDIASFGPKRPLYPLPAVVHEDLSAALAKYGNIPQKF